MPARTEDYEVLLDFVNDTHDCATVQLLRDYGRNSGTIVLLHPGESVTLVLDAGVSRFRCLSDAHLAHMRRQGRCTNTRSKRAPRWSMLREQ